MSQHQTITVAGQTFNSIAAAIKHFDVPRSTAYKKIANKEKLEDVFNVSETKTKRQFEPHEITCHGEKFESIAQFSSHHGLNANKVRGRLFRGQSPEEILDKLSPETPKNEKSLRVKGKTFTSIDTLADTYNIPFSLVEARLSAGWTASQAVEVTKAPNTQADSVIALTVGKKSFKNVTEMALSHKVDEAALIALMFLGIKPGPAIKKLKQDKKDHIIYNGHAYKSERELAVAHNTPLSSFYKRRSKGMTIAESLKPAQKKAAKPKRVEKTTSETGKRQSVSFRGETYPSIRAFANAFGIDYKKVHYRLKNGWTYAQAIEKNKPPVDKKPAPTLLNIKDMLPITVEGKQFDSAVELANYYNLNAPRVTGRLRNGWTPEEAVELSSRGDDIEPDKNAEQLALFEQSENSNTPAQLAYDGKTYENLSELCSDLGLNYNRVSARLRNKWTLEAAITTPAKKRGRPAKVSNKSKLQAQATAERLRKAKKGVEKKGPFDLNSTVKLGKKNFKSVKTFSKHFHLDESVTLERMNAGWSPTEIIGEAPPPHWS